MAGTTNNASLATAIAEKNSGASTKLSAQGAIQKWLNGDGMKTLGNYLTTPQEQNRMVAGFLYSIQRSVDLLECTPASLISCLLQCAQLGLYPGALQEISIISFGRKTVIEGRETRVKEAQIVPGYMGLVKLGKQGGYIMDIHSNVVYEHDYFDWEEGTHKFLRHKKSLLSDRGARVGVYACATVAGGCEFIVMAPHEVESIKKRSRSANSDYSPWNTDTDQMWKKTAIKQLCKLIPKQGEAGERLANAIEADNEIERPDLRKPPIVEFDVTAPNQEASA